jgi:hypothetical protein
MGKKKEKKTAKKSSRRLVGVTGALGAALTAGAGAYYLLGPKSKLHQQKAKALAKRLAGEWNGMQSKGRSAGRKTKKST